MSSDLLRQRRNLLIISVVLIFLKYAEIEITEFSIVGIKFSSFRNPESVFIVLWIAWLYFTVRYYQYFIQEGLPNFKSTFINILDQISTKKINSTVKEKYPENLKAGVNYSKLKEWNWLYHGEHMVSLSDSIASSFENFEMEFPKKALLPEIIHSAVSSVLNRSAFTDYVLPFIVAIIAFCYCLAEWDGSLLVILKKFLT